ncbi:L-amino-acid oxidase [Carlito syrichta]|uniref:L-amino-acid oxidase n=1 Tax=Carlito syrichta TaxID=1868482 RepID=A0A3Q0DY13_CARSF|nr:L-amino-acid oxidase [Carlito syrichta]
MGAERAPQSQPCTLHFLVLIPILLSLVASLDWRANPSQDPLEKCMHDPDYEQLLKVVTLGLNRTLKPQRVIVVGAGVAGLVAAKVLSDAGHKVTILEADSRVGGRIFTYRDRKTGWIGELGAMRMPSSHRILHKLCKSLGLNLTKFTQYDENAWTEVHNVKLRNYVVEKIPEKLGYALHPREKGHSPEDIYQMALNQAIKDVTVLGCRKAMKKFERHTLLEYLLGEGNLSQPAVKLLGDVMSKDGFFYLSFAEALRAHSSLSDRLQLPRRLRETLRGLHYVPATKVFLSFRRPFWQDEHIEGGHSNTDRPSRTIYYPPPRDGALLLASYTWSDAASAFAGLSLDQALRVALDDVAELHGPIVHRLWDRRGVVKRWAEDPHSQGGFVVQPPVLWQAQKEAGQGYNWAAPSGRVYFAGEHTALPHGWVETAVKSALRAAIKINSRKWPVPETTSPEEQGQQVPRGEASLCDLAKGGTPQPRDQDQFSPPHTTHKRTSY